MSDLVLIPFPGLGTLAGEEPFNVARAMGHSKSEVVDSVYAHALPSGMASVAEHVTARALGEQRQLRLVSGNEQVVDVNGAPGRS